MLGDRFRHLAGAQLSPPSLSAILLQVAYRERRVESDELRVPVDVLWQK